MDDPGALREAMVRRQLEPRGIDDPRVLGALRAVPRHRFVPELGLREAHADRPQPIGLGQTISQPYVVAWTAQLLELDGSERVLDVGTGCGYAAAVLARLAAEVVGVERHAALVERARATLAELGVDDVTLVHGDGSRGHAPAAPYDAIAVAAAAPAVPHALVEQLADGGRLVLPVGGRGAQRMVRVRRDGDELLREDLGGVRFVPLVADADG